MPAVYTAVATATGEGRDGRARSSDGLLEVDLAVPPEMGGPGGATNPEQLFAAGWAACFHSALKGVARRRGVTFTDSAVTAEVGIGPDGDGGYGLQAALHVELGGIGQAEAEQLVEAAHQVCPYSNATRGNVPVVLETVTA
ncbi:organic hydroperoxide resistance protein [Kineococcus terrestris]|uniref:organic hydroperoxide resistance protein n=1 Tax=Kineococcus terrestris TaxID=2044856 RepID=UPI0034DB38CE